MRRLIYFMLLLGIVSCNQMNSNGSDCLAKYAQEAFIMQCSYMSERDANSNEIDYYKAPEITEAKFTCLYTGKDLVHLCNQIEEKNEYKSANPIQFGPTTYSITYPVGDIKEFALDNMNSIVASQYHFSGIFTNYNKETKYSVETSNVLIIPKLGKIILFSDKGANGYWYVRGISDFELPWYERL